MYTVVAKIFPIHSTQGLILLLELQSSRTISAWHARTRSSQHCFLAENAVTLKVVQQWELMWTKWIYTASLVTLVVACCIVGISEDQQNYSS